MRTTLHSKSHNQQFDPTWDRLPILIARFQFFQLGTTLPQHMLSCLKFIVTNSSTSHSVVYDERIVECEPDHIRGRKARHYSLGHD